jgi:hypothetical protein
VNRSALLAKVTEAHSVSRTQAQGVVDRMLKSLASARGTGGRLFKMAAKLWLAHASQPVRGED